MNNYIEETKIHFGSIFIFIGTIFLFMGNGASLGIADNVPFFIIAILLNVIDYLRLKDKKFSLNFFNIFSFIIIFGSILFMLLGQYDNGSALSLVVLSALLLTTDLVHYNKKDLKIIIYGIVYSTLIFSLLVILKGNEFAYIGSSKYTFTQFFGKHIEFEPNYLACFLLMGFCLNIYLLFKYPFNKFRKILHVLSSLVILLAILLTGSRSAYLSIAVFFLCYFIFTNDPKVQKILLKIFLFGVLAVIVMFAVGIIPTSIINKLLHLNLLDGSNMKRLKDWYYGICAIVENPIFGNGPILTPVLLKQLFGFHGDVHNTFITFGVFFGIFFLLYIIYNVCGFISHLYKNNEDIFLSLFFALILEWNILACQYTVNLWLMLILFLIIYKGNKEGGKNND